MGLTLILSGNNAAAADPLLPGGFQCAGSCAHRCTGWVKAASCPAAVFGTVFVLMDEFPELSGPDSGFSSPATLCGTSVTLHLQVEDAARVWQQALDAGAQTIIPLERQFWGELYGRLKDPSGHEWSIAQMVEQLADHEVAQAAKGCYPIP